MIRLASIIAVFVFKFYIIMTMNKRILKLLENYENEAVLISDNKDLYYLTGAQFGDFYLLLHKKYPAIIVHEMIAPQVNQYFKKLKNKIKIFTTKEDCSSKLVEVLKKYKINGIVIDVSKIYAENFDTLKKKLTKEKIKVIKEKDITQNLRLIKDEKEIENLHKACTIVSEVFETVKKQVVAGMTELDIYFKIEEEFAKRHVVQSFKTIVASGPNSANPHHNSGNRKIQKNDIVMIDMGCVYNGYCSDLTRTFFIGNKTKFQQKIWDIVKLAHDRAIAEVKDGMKAKDIDFFAANTIKKEGYAKQFIHTTGHSLGLDIHEQLRISKPSTAVLREGTVITVEPGIYIENKFGVRIEDTVLVTKNGYRVLTCAKY